MSSIDDLICDLAIAKGDDLRPAIVSQLKKLLEGIEPKEARLIVNEITSLDFLPRNLIGAVRSRWQEIQNSKNQYDRTKYYVAPEDRAKPEDFKMIKIKIDQLCKKYAF